MNQIPSNYQAYRLLHEGSEALADVEEYGLRINTRYCEKKQKQLKKEIKERIEELDKFKEIKIWKKTYGKKFNLDSDQQLAKILFEKMKYKSEVETAKGNASVSAEALEKLNIPVVKNLIKIRQLKKVKDTYLQNYLRESVDNVLHPFFHLHIAKSFRSSSSKINFQNQPVRIPEIREYVRKAVIPRKGFLIAEVDYSGVEVRIAACYHKDPNMIKDITTQGRDMHRDMAAKCFRLNKKQVTKDARYCGKNMFVFPQFYGDYYGNNANSMWEAIHTLKLQTVKGTPLKKHLKKKGITNLKKFTDHIASVEDYFWNERYGVYGQWKEDHWEKYCKNGYVEIKTGFTCKGLMKRNEAINYPIQGAAFHCLLWSLIQLNKWLKKNKMKTKIIGQIHDSIVMEIHSEELNIVLEETNKIMTKDIVRHWPWIIVPLEIEVELCPINKSWYWKNEVIEPDFICDCNSKWLYKTEKGWKCPICGRKYRKE